MKKIFKLLMVLIFLTSFNAGAEWLLVAENENSKFYVESESIRKAPPFITFWEKRNLKQPAVYSEKSGKTYRSSVSKIQGDCYNLKSMTLSSSFYTGFNQKGDLLGTDDLIKLNIAEWSDQIPGSMGDYSLKYACSKNK